MGHRWSLPFTTDARAFFYNKAIFREAGLDPERPPRTWNELRDISLRLTRTDGRGKLTRMGFAPLIGAGFGSANLQTYAWQKGGDWMDPAVTHVTLNSPAWVSSLEWWVDFVNQYPGGGLKGILAFSSDFGGYSQDPFVSGKIAMQEHGIWYLATIKKYAPNLDFGVAEIPIPEGGKPAFQGSGFSLAIPRGARHVEEAWEFVKFATDNEAQQILAEAVDAIPVNYEAAHSHYFMQNPVRRFFIDRFEYCHSYPPSPISVMAYNAAIRAVEQAIYKKLTPKQALDQAATDLEAELTRIREVQSKPLINWNRLGLITLLGIVLGGVSLLVYLRGRLRSRLVRQEAMQGFFMAAPWLLGFLAFSIGPIVISLIYSLCDYQVLTPARYVGLDNYVRLFRDDELVRKSIFNTFYFTFIGVPLGVTGSLLLALLLNCKVPGIRLFRTLFYVPSIISGVAVCVLWMWLLNPESGLVNQMLAKIGLPGPLWLGDEHWSKPAIILMGLWGVGGGTIIFLAGLQAIPPQLYEAVKIDGASQWRSFLHVTLPMLSPTIFFNLVVGIIAGFQIFTQAFVLTQGLGGPVDSTLFYALYLFRHAFIYFNMGYASALAWVLFIIVLIFTGLQMWLSKHWVYYEETRK
jgi:multiple sugar transport system permease protein